MRSTSRGLACGRLLSNAFSEPAIASALADARTAEATPSADADAAREVGLDAMRCVSVCGPAAGLVAFGRSLPGFAVALCG